MKERKPYDDPKPSKPDKYGMMRKPKKTPREIMMQTPPQNMDIKNAADDPLEVGFDVLKAAPCPVCGAIGREIGLACPAQAPAVICPIRKKETGRAMRGRNVRVVGPAEERMSLDDMRNAFVVRRSEEIEIPDEIDFGQRSGLKNKRKPGLKNKRERKGLIRRSERMCDICHKEPALPNYRVCQKHHDQIKGMQGAMGLDKMQDAFMIRRSFRDGLTDPMKPRRNVDRTTGKQIPADESKEDRLARIKRQGESGNPAAMKTYREATGEKTPAQETMGRLRSEGKPKPKRKLQFGN